MKHMSPQLVGKLLPLHRKKEKVLGIPLFICVPGSLSTATNRRFAVPVSDTGTSVACEVSEPLPGPSFRIFSVTLLFPDRSTLNRLPRVPSDPPGKTQIFASATPR